MTGPTTVVAPCPDIPPGWPWALCQAAPRRPAVMGGGGTTLRPLGSGFAAPLSAPPRLPRGRRCVSRRVPFIILCVCCPCALWPGLWAWSLPPCGTVLVQSRLLGRRVALAALGGGGGPEAPRLADRAAACAVVVPHRASPTRTPPPLSPRRPCGSLRPPCARSSEAWAVAQVASKQSGHWTVHSLRYLNSTPCTRVGDAVVPRRG